MPGEAAAILRVDPKTISRLAARGVLPFVRTPGGYRRFRESQVRALVSKLGFAEEPGLDIRRLAVIQDPKRANRLLHPKVRLAAEYLPSFPGAIHRAVKSRGVVFRG